MIIFNNLPTAEALKISFRERILYNTLVFQCQNANAEAGHLDSLIDFSLFYSYSAFIIIIIDQRTRKIRSFAVDYADHLPYFPK